jgi:hypothetical protein
VADANGRLPENTGSGEVVEGMRANHKLLTQLNRELDREVKQIKRDHPFLPLGNAFVLWFVEAKITGDRANALKAIIGQPGDMGADAVYLDEGLRMVHLVQGKYHQKPDANDSADLLKFARFGTDLCSAGFKQMLKSMGKQPGIPAKKRLLEAHAKLNADSKPPFTMRMYFGTNGRVTPVKEREARRIAKAPGNTELEVVTGHDMPALFHEWQVGICPPLPKMEIGIDGQDSIFYQAGRLQGWIFTATADEIGGLYDKAKERIFARNIRGYRGDTTINDAILESAEKNADRFWFMNNGITIVADRVEQIKAGPKVRMHMWNPQVVNGQQTIRSLEKAKGSHSKVLVRVIRLDDQDVAQGFGGLVRDIVQATNRQNAVSAADLMANDPEQVRIEREFAKLQYAYERKRQARTEFAEKAANRLRVKREEMANAVASTTSELGPHTVRRPDLWERQYGRLFMGKRQVTDYLARWWAAKQLWNVDAPLIKEARWVVLGCLWRWPVVSLNGCLSSRAQRWAFIRACQDKDGAILGPLRTAAKQFFTCAKPIYVKAKKAHAQEKKEEGDPFKVLTPDAYFRQKGTDEQVLKAAKNDPRRKHKITHALKTFRARLLNSVNCE